MRYHQARLIRKNQDFVRNCTVCSLFIVALISALAMAA